MQITTIKKINQLNQDFYAKTSQSFNQTRQYPWAGWGRLLPLIRELPQPPQVLDLGCGNARFAEFLSNSQIEFSYFGVDCDSGLLEIAQKKLDSLQVQHILKRVDLVEALLEKKLPDCIDKKFDLVVVFGVLHHIPSKTLRQQLFSQVASWLNSPESLGVLTAWQFAQDERFTQKFIAPEKVGLTASHLEENDFLLGWKDSPNAVRYCHFIDHQELQEIFSLSQNLSIKQTFFADGKSNQLNLYIAINSQTI